MRLVEARTRACTRSPLTETRTVSIDLVSETADTQMVLHRGSLETLPADLLHEWHVLYPEIIGTDDTDSEGDSRLVRTLEAGHYLIGAAPFEGERGTFALEVRRADR